MLLHQFQPMYKLLPLPTYVPRGFTHQPLDGGQLWDSSTGSSFERKPHGGPPFNPLVGSYGCPTPDPHMIIPPWYEPPIVQPILKLATKLSYMKL